ncbi:CHAT domain-containing protein [Microseira sp. BLCC-F43]|jgi:WD40 repeat protein|uniref:nSTAND1 domain-containing NTPase n=1 Tax=Microseira sp. BLCC-F43 TaxID=3153602 RepID=UPI0035B8F120
MITFQHEHLWKGLNQVVSEVNRYDMSKTVVIHLGSGDLYSGFPRVTAQLWIAEHPGAEQFIGSLPAAPDLVNLYRNWQSIYQHLCDRKQLRSSLAVEDDDDELEIDQGSITNVSVVGFSEACQKLQEGINSWLSCAEFLNIDRQLRSQLDTKEEIRVIIETNDDLLRRLPWHRWNLFEDYPLAEIALSRPEYKRRNSSQPKIWRNQVRILAILGDSQGIDLEAETNFLKQLPDAEVEFLVNPSRAEFNAQLWHKLGWDILFFAGHSQTEGETGRIYLNENKTNNSLTIEQLQEALKAAIENGLKLAIFNSCDGLGLALALEKLNLTATIVMREPVPNRVAQDFFKQFLAAFAVERLPLYVSVQRSRRKLQGLEDDFPGASWLPVICMNPAVEPPNWLQLGGIPPCPYRGLFAFREEDVHLFFGREEFTLDLVKAVKTKPLVAVVGPSGSGKSSVVFAGLIPSLRRDERLAIGDWQLKNGTPLIISFRPGNNPFKALAIALASLWYQNENHKANSCRLTELELEIALKEDDQALYKIIQTILQQNSGSRFILIADQFEELYTQTPEQERQSFLDLLLTAIRLAGAFTLVLTLRADFYGHALSNRSFSDALQGAVHNLGPMCREELQRAIAKPAALMQVKLEEGLTNKLIHAASGHSGRLPLLEFALTQLWSKQKDGWLTHQAYEEIGGVEEALANHAETVYAQLDEADRLRTQRVLIQLVQPGVGTDDNRRLATRDEVKQENWDLVTRLASARLVVTNCNASTGEETVEIVHEALIRCWGRLGHWMQVNAEFRLWQEQLRASVRQWIASSFDQGALLRGKPLADAQYWYQQRRDELSQGEKSLIELSLELRDKKLKKQKLRRQLTIWGLIGGLAIASTVASFAWWRWQNSEIKAYSEASEALFASDKKLDALIEGLKAGKLLKSAIGVEPLTEIRAANALQQAVYWVRENNRLQGHKNRVNSVTWSPNGKILASASDDNTIKLWNLEGKEIGTLEGHTAAVNSISISPNGKILVSGSNDGTIKLWTLKGKEIRTLKYGAGVNSVSISPDGKIVASAGGGTIKLWNLNGKEIRTLKHNTEVIAVSISPDGKMLAAGTYDGTIELWSLDGKKIKTLKAHQEDVMSVSFSPDGQMLASTGYDKTVKLWRIADGKELWTRKGHSDSVWNVSFSPDGKMLASASIDKTIKIWNLEGKLLETLNNNSWVYGVAWSPNGKTLAAANIDKTIKLWCFEDKELKKLAGHNDVVRSASFSPDGETIATGSDDATIKLWSRDGKLINTFKGHSGKVYSVAWSSNGKMLVSGSDDNSIKLWRIADGKELLTLKHQNAVRSVSISPDSKMLISGSDDNTIKLWRIADGKEILTLKGRDSIYSISISPDGKTLASGGFDNNIQLWRIADGKLLSTLKGHSNSVRSVAWSPDGKKIASASTDNTIKLWNLEGKELLTLNGNGGWVYSVAWSPDGKTIAAANDDNSIKLWSIDGKELRRLTGHSDKVRSVSISPNGKTLVSAGSDRHVFLWNLELLELDILLKHGCDRLHDYLKTNPNVSPSDRHLCKS